MDKCFAAEELNIFRYPARIICAGFSNSGKTSLVIALIKKYELNFTHIIICGADSHPLQNDVHIKDKLYLHKDISDPMLEVSEFEKEKANILLVLDDLFLKAVDSPTVVDVFTKGRHNNISVILITQNLFHRGKYACDINLNASHFLLCRMRDMSQIETLARQIFGKGEKPKKFLEVYKKSVLLNPFAYLLIDLALNTPTELMLRSKIVGESDYEVVYLL